MKLYAIVIAILCVLFAAIPSYGEEKTEDDLKWEQLEKAGMAQQYYALGQKSYKKNDLRNAARFWMMALQLKPDSTDTQKNLNKAREQLYKKYIEYKSKEDVDKDPLTAYVVLDGLVPLLPDKTDLASRRTQLKDGFNEYQLKAIDAYNQAQAYIVNRMFDKAKESINIALDLAGNAKCIKDSAQNINDMIRANETILVGSGSQRTMHPKMIYLGADWCPFCRIMHPILEEIKNNYADKLDMIHIDTEKQPEEAEKWNIECIPTIVFLDSNGYVYSRTEGMQSYQQLQSTISGLVK